MIDCNIKDIIKYIDKLKAMNKLALERASKKSLARVNTASWKMTKERYPKIRKSVDNDKFQSFAHQTSRFINRDQRGNIEAILKGATKPVSIIHAVVGSRSPRKQKGIRVRARKPIFVRIAGTKKPLGPNQMIASPLKTRGADVTQVFNKTKRGLVKETYSSLYDLLRFPENQSNLAKILEEVTVREFDRVFGK